MSHTVGAPAIGPGVLVVVGTPIGNLGDLSPRAADALRDADLVYCEDTRRSRKLLSHAGIAGATLRSLHGHNERARIEEVCAAVSEGKCVVLVSDAGMPLISDPGEAVVAAVVAAGLDVTVVPGPSAVTGALAVSGLPTDRFCFEGFLPRSGAARRERLAALADEPRTSVLFEAPTRVSATLDELAAACGPERRVAVARELTKVHEECFRGTLDGAAAWARGNALRGEVVIVLAGAEPEEQSVDDEVLIAALADRAASGSSTRDAVGEVTESFGVPRRRVYRLAIDHRTDAGRGGSSEPESGPD